VPDGSARGRYDLDVWTFDVAASYDYALSDDWALRPKVGGTLLVIDREAVQEGGPSAFAAQIAGERDEAAFVDASLALAGGRAIGATVRPFASIGLRYQLSGRNSVTLAGFGGGDLGLAIEGAKRAQVVGTGSLGIEADLAPKVTLFGIANAERGEDDHQESVHAGIRLAF
jgi:outer membrane autotransporter protein